MKVEERILILAPLGEDAANAAYVLEKANMLSEICSDLTEVTQKFIVGAGALLITEEALTSTETHFFVDTLRKQEIWSDIPIIMITSSGEATALSLTIVSLFDTVGNINLLERPLRAITLVAAAQVALRSRRRQYQMKALLEEIKRSNNELEAFAYIASHDLKEPLNIISSFADLLKRRLDKTAADTEKTFLGHIKQAATQAQTLVKDLLNYSQLGQNREIETINIKSIVDEVCLILKPIIEHTKAEIQYEDLPIIQATHLEMIQLFQNLIQNALKYRGTQTSTTDQSRPIPESLGQF